MHGTRRIRGRAGLVILGLLVGLWLATGCSQSPRPADPGAARQALQTVLDAWKGGRGQEAFIKESSIHTADPRWSAGYKLLGYEIAAGEKHHGYDLHLEVTLRLEDRKGKPAREKVIYRVATAPRSVVIRHEEF